MSLTLEATRYGNYILEADDGRSILFQSDWDYPSLARNLGWGMALTEVDIEPLEPESMEGKRMLVCTHNGTDGTVQCPSCGAKPGVFIQAAINWLDANDGETFEDTDYEDCLEE